MERGFEQVAVRPPVIGAEPQHMRAADRGAQLELAADPGRRRIALVEHRAEAARTEDDIGEMSRLHITEQVEGPDAAPTQPQSRLQPPARTHGASQAPRPTPVDRQPPPPQPPPPRP